MIFGSICFTAAGSASVIAVSSVAGVASRIIVLLVSKVDISDQQRAAENHKPHIRSAIGWVDERKKLEHLAHQGLPLVLVSALEDML
jgi:hypothetical protein